MKSEEESKFMQLWHNKRTHAAMVLGMWMIFLLFVIIISFVGSKKTQNNNLNTPVQKEEETVEFRDYALMQTDLLKNNYKYEYNIKVADYNVIYKGEKIGVKETGYRENSVETIKYYVDETGLYTVMMDSLNSNDRLYENINESFIDLEYIFELVKDKSVVTEEVENKRTFKYSFNLEDIQYEIIVTTNLNDIESIQINFEDKNYSLKFTEVNKLEILSYEPTEVN